MCLVISSIAKAAHVGLKEVLSFAFGSRVSLPATLSTWQKAPRKQTGSLQRGERSMCARFRSRVPTVCAQPMCPKADELRLIGLRSRFFDQQGRGSFAKLLTNSPGNVSPEVGMDDTRPRCFIRIIARLVGCGW